MASSAPSTYCALGPPQPDHSDRHRPPYTPTPTQTAHPDHTSVRTSGLSLSLLIISLAGAPSPILADVRIRIPIPQARAKSTFAKTLHTTIGDSFKGLCSSLLRPLVLLSAFPHPSPYPGTVHKHLLPVCPATSGGSHNLGGCVVCHKKKSTGAKHIKSATQIRNSVASPGMKVGLGKLGHSGQVRASA